MSAIIALTPGSQMPAYLRKENRTALAAINADVVHGPSYPILSIKGKVFTLVKGSERKIMTRADDPDEVLQFLHLTPVRANTKTRVYYANAYVEGSDDIQRPDCQSADGITPSADSRNIQSPKCATCKHAVWGSKANADGKGTACTVNTRLAVVDPEQAAAAAEIEPYLLRVPAGSRSNFADVVKTAESRGIPYNALVLKVGFDKEAPSPKLTFKIVGLASDAVYEKISAAYDGEVVKDMMGLGPVRAALPAPAQSTATEDDLEAALAARNAEQAAAVAKAKPAPAAAAEASVEDLDALLGGGAPAEEAAAPAPAPAPAPAKVRATAPAKPKAPPAPPPAPAPAPAQAAAQATADDLGGLLGDLDGLLGSIDD
jgi:hypothetical protein